MTERKKSIFDDPKVREARDRLVAAAPLLSPAQFDALWVLLRPRPKAVAA